MPLLIQTPSTFVASQALANGESQNLCITTSVGSNALTVALRTKANAVPTAGDPIYVAFRNSTATSGLYTVRSVTAATQVVVSFGSTLGMASGVAGYIYVYAIDNSGTVELAVSRMPYYTGSITTTAEGGIGGADSNSDIYSTTARVGVPCLLVGRIDISEATAGTWVTNATQLSVSNFSIPPMAAHYNTTVAQTISNNSETIVNYATKVHDFYNCVTTGASWKFTAPFGGFYSVQARVGIQSAALSTTTQIFGRVYKTNSLLVTGSIYDGWASLTKAGSSQASTTISMAIGDYVDFRVTQITGGNQDLDGNTQSNTITVTFLGTTA